MARRWAKYFLFLAAGLAIFYFIELFYFQFRMKFPLKSNKVSMEDMNTGLGTTTEQEKTKTLLLVYTVFFGTEKWIQDRGSCGFEDKFQFTAKKCLSGDFELTYDKHRFKESDLVIFHARDMPNVGHLGTLLKDRPKSQRWVYALWESPNVTPNPAPLNGLFNLTWTYRSDSDFWSPYGSYVVLSEEEKINKTRNIPDYSQGKTEPVAWRSSNCRAQPRISLVQELKKYIKVDVFKRCSEMFGQRRGCPAPMSNCLQTKYKFYLSFENALCEDYITEKYWNVLGEDLNVVPVVMGGADYTKLAIPGSYINVLDFKTVKQLADYLHYLDTNSTAYNEYFKWRLKYKVFRGNLDLSLCQICKWYVSKSLLEPKVYHDLADHWVTKGKCNAKNHLVTNMWET